eukprot:241975_1
MEDDFEETSLQQLVTPSVSKMSSNYSKDGNKNEYGPESFNVDYSQTEIAKLSRVENKLNRNQIIKKWNAYEATNNKLSLLQFCIMIFMITCGGPFGIESAIRSIGFFYTLIGLIVIPILFAIPQILICSELSSMITTNGNLTICVYRAFYDNKKYGDFLGFMNGLNCVIGYGFDLPIYIVLLYQYLDNLFDMEFNIFQQYFIKFSFLIAGALFCSINIQIIGKTTIFFAIIILLPFFIGFFYALSEPNLNSSINESFNNNDNNNEWMLGLSTLIWLYSGWPIMCMVCGEIKFSKKKIHLPFIMAIVLDFLVYSLTLIVAATVNCENNCWSDGYLSIVYNNLLNNLGLFISISAIVSNFCKYIILLSAHSRSLWAISQPYIMLLPNGKTIMNENQNNNINNEYENNNDDAYRYDDDDDDDLDDIINNNHELETVVSNIAFDDNNFHSLTKIPIGILPQYFIGTTWNKTKSPVRAVCFTTVINAVLISFSFASLVEISAFFTCFTFVFKCVAFIKLRYMAPNVYRPYKICGGIYEAWFVSLCQFATVMLLVVVSIIQEPYIFIITIAMNVLIIIWYLFYRYSCGKLNETNSSSSLKERSNEQSTTWYTSNTKNIW